MTASSLSKTLPLFLCLLVPAAFTGCVALAAGAGAGTVAYIRGDLRASIEADMEHTYRATQQAVRDLELNLINEQKDALSAVFNLRTANDRKVAINLKKDTRNVTDISIRVGVFGDERLSRQIYDRIRERI